LNAINIAVATHELPGWLESSKVKHYAT